MYRSIKSNEEILARSFNRLLSHVNDKPCCFITAYRGEFSGNENKKRNKELESDIRSSGLSFTKLKGSYPEEQADGTTKQESEYSFCVIDNKYSFEQFKSLCVDWCKKYDQDSVLITNPVHDKTENGKKLFKGVGRFYDKSGSELGDPFTDITFHDIEDYFSKIGGSAFTFIGASDFVETKGWSLRSYNGHVLGDQEFRKKYPHLV